jgi:hypothetical protein
MLERGEEPYAARAKVEVALALFQTAFRAWTHADERVSDPPSLDQLIQDAYAIVGLADPRH